MTRQMVTRSERRMEKKQAIILLFLVLGVALVSFVLGVMVGRGSSPKTVTAEIVETRERLPVAPEKPETEPQEPVQAPEKSADASRLTFYDTLPKGDQTPLGSGINRPPQSKEKTESITVQVKAPEKPAPVKVESRPEPAAPPTEPQPAAAEGRFVVQVASFQKSEDAKGLSSRLGQKGYQAFTQQADLGAKGIWHRVLVGPFVDNRSAAQTVERLKAEEKLSAIVKKR